MSKKKKKINNTAEEIKDVVTETEVSLDELDKFEPDVKEQHHTPEAAPKKVEEADNSESITEEEEVHDLIEGDLIEDFDYLEDDVPEESAEEAVEEVVENTDSQPKKEKKPKEKKEKKGRESMRNRKVKIFALVMAGCLCLSGLTGCGGGIKMTTDDTSSKSDSGLMGSAKKEADKSDESEADSADEEDKISDDMIGRYVSQGYENPSFGFAINLPDTYTLENRNNVALNDEDIVESSNSEGTYDYLKSLISLGSAVVFSAEDGNTYIELNIQNAAVLDKTAKWDEEKNIAENSVMTEEDAKKLMGEDAQVTEFQNNVEEITFLGEKHYAAQYTFKNYDVSYYGVTVFLVNEQDSQYMLAVNIIGVDLNVVDQADQFFSVYTE